jgi:hypothetical protein
VTGVPTTEAPSVFVPSGRPVVRFVAVLAGVAAVFVVLWWSGLFAARVDISVSAGFDRQTNTGVAVVMVRNEGSLRARVGPLTLWSRPDSGRYYEPPVRVTGQAPRREVRVDGGDTTRFTVRYAVDCAEYDRARDSERGAVGPSLRLRLHAEGVVGSGRSITHAEVALVGACGDPIDLEGE